ncbi:MAG: hypothetical protein ACT4P2_11640 [Pseudomonadota bacterium]
MRAGYKPAPTKCHLADLAVPFGDEPKSPAYHFPDARLMDFAGGGTEVQVSLGRDILCLGLFHIIGCQRTSTLCL